jgi:signal transduction histidine kinase
MDFRSSPPAVPGLSQFAPMLAIVAAVVVLVNLLAWLAIDRLFLAEARQMDRENASLQAERIGHLLEREARGLQRVVLGRADRLARDVAVQHSGLGAVDFVGSISEVFLGGANIDAYLVEDAAGSVHFARRREPSNDVLVPMASAEQEFLAKLPWSAATDHGSFAGFAVAPDGAVVMVVGVQVGHQSSYGWLIARRDLTAGQISSYGEIVESPFTVRAVTASAAADSGASDGIFIDTAAGQVRWSLHDLTGRPSLQLSTLYNNEYELHMLKVVAISRGGVLILSFLTGMLAVLLHLRQKENRLREQAVRQKEERFARLAAVGELAAGVAHEVNNPIGMIRRNLDFVRDAMHDALPLLAERDDADLVTIGGIELAMAREQLPQLLDDMVLGSRRIGEIVCDLKDFARDDSPEDAVSFELNEAVATAVRLLDGTIRKSTDHFRLMLGGGLPPVFGNLRQIEQVVLNLVQNACQALPDRTAAIAVVTRYDAGRRCNLVEVVNEGVGIAPEHRERVFEPFFTTRRESGGTGLGLSVSLRIVMRHGGTLEVDSVSDCGTLVTMSLPIVEEKS